MSKLVRDNGSRIWGRYSTSQRPLARQRLRRAHLALDQVRRGLPARLRLGQPSQTVHRPLHRLLQYHSATLQPESAHARSGILQSPARIHGSLKTKARTSTKEKAKTVRTTGTTSLLTVRSCFCCSRILACPHARKLFVDGEIPRELICYCPWFR